MSAFMIRLWAASTFTFAVVTVSSRKFIRDTYDPIVCSLVLTVLMAVPRLLM